MVMNSVKPTAKAQSEKMYMTGGMSRTLLGSPPSSCGVSEVGRHNCFGGTLRFTLAA